MKQVVHASATFGYMMWTCWVSYMLACRGSRIGGHAPEPLLPPYLPCLSTFREKANPEEITFPYRMTLSITGLGDAEGQLVRELVGSPRRLLGVT